MSSDKSQRSSLGIVLVVTLSALLGMVLGGLFGLAAGYLAPDLFSQGWELKEIEPVGTAVVVGAFGGVMCGGVLGSFAVLVQSVMSILARRHGESR